jgi:hypothetical protein
MGQLFGQQKVVEAMERALEEGKQFDQEMTALAESEVNPAMVAEEEETQEDEGEEEGGKRSGGSSRKSSGGRKK